MLLYLDSLQPGKTYSIQVRGNDGETYSEWSQTFSIPVTSDTGTLPDITTPTCTPVGDTFVATWGYPSKPLDFAHYEVRWYNGTTYSPTFKTAGETITLTFSNNVAFFTNPAPSVRVEVRPVDRTGNKPVTWAVSSYGVNPAPTQATNVVGTAGPDKISLAWDKAAFDDYKYAEVWVGATNAANTTGATRIFSGDANSWTYVTLSYAAVMYFKVAFYDKFNQPGPYSVSAGLTPTNPSLVDVTPPADPTTAITITTTNDTTNYTGSISRVNVSFAAGTGAADLAGHKIRYSTSAGGPWTYVDLPLIGTPTGGSTQVVDIDGLPSNTNIYVRVAAYDKFNNVSGYVASATGAMNPILTAKDVSGPSKPSKPTVAVGTMQIQVSHDMLKDAGGAMDTDTSYFEVYASTSTPVTVSTANFLGTMKAGPAVSGIWSVPATDAGTPSNTTQQWYARVVARDTSGNASTSSDTSVSTANVPLISSANIGYATITSAKITTLDANQITAGTTITNSLLVGDANGGGLTVQGGRGFIQSSNYVPGQTGWRLAKEGLEINQGSISAQSFATTIANYMPAIYSLFDWTPSFYYSAVPVAITYLTDASWAAGGIGASFMGTTVDNGSILAWNAGNGSPSSSNNGLWFGKSSTDYNIFVAPSTQYTFSLYNSMYGSGTMVFSYKDQAGNQVNSSAISTSGTQTRRTWTFTTGANVTSIILGIHSATVGYHEITGLQFEQGGSATTYKYPDNTRIDGAMIRTGQITSTGTTTINGILQPKWSINMAGQANFADVTIRGNAVVGAGVGSSVDGGASVLQSANFITGSDGWQIKSDGNAEFNSLIARNTFTIQSATSGARIQMTNSAIQAYTSGGVNTVNITNAGSFTVQSNSSGARTVVDGSGIRGYNSSGSNLFNVSSSTGAMTVTGSFTIDSDPSSPTNRGILLSSSGVVYFYPDYSAAPSGASPGNIYATEGISVWSSPNWTSYPYRSSIVMRPGAISGEQEINLGGGTSGTGDCTLFCKGVYTATSGSSANMVINGSYVIGRSTSSIKFKREVEPYNFSDVNIDKLRMVTYHDKTEYEKEGSAARRWVGAIAEELEEDSGWRQFVTYGDEDEPNGIMYDRIALLAIAKIRELTARIEVLEAA